MGHPCHAYSPLLKYHHPLLPFSPFTVLPSPPSSLGNLPFRPNRPGYPPWDALEPAVVLNPQEPVYSNSGSYGTEPASGLVRSRINPKTCPSDAVVDERVRRRRLSNQESARRSHMRKQKHLENLRNELNRLRLMNRELLNRVMLAVHQGQLVHGENERLRSEVAILRRRLCDVRRDLLFRQLDQQHFSPSTWQYCNNVTSINGQLPQYYLIS